MKRSFLMFLAASALVGCSESELSEPVDGSLIALKSVAYTADATTRAPFVGTIGATNVLTARVIAAETGDGKDYSTPYADGTMTFNSASAATYDLASLDDTNKAKFPAGNVVKLFGVYPATGWESPDATGASITFTGKEDVMAAKEVLVTKATVAAGIFETLAFNHLLTKLEVKFKAEASFLSNVGTIKSVKLVGNATGSANLTNKVIFTAAGGGVEFDVTESPVTALPFYGVTEAGGVKTYTEGSYTGRSYEPTITSTLQAYAMVAPTTASLSKKDEYYLEVVRTVGGVDKTDHVSFDLMKADGTAFTESTAGNAFTVVVNYIDQLNIKAVATVNDWVENGEYISDVVTPAS